MGVSLWLRQCGGWVCVQVMVETVWRQGGCEVMVEAVWRLGVCVGYG